MLIEMAIAVVYEPAPNTELAGCTCEGELMCVKWAFVCGRKGMEISPEVPSYRNCDQIEKECWRIYDCHDRAYNHVLTFWEVSRPLRDPSLCLVPDLRCLNN